MADTTALARKFRIEVNMGTEAVPVWELLKGVYSFNPTLSPTSQDDDDYESGGWGSTTKTKQVWGAEIGLRRKYDDAGSYPATQEKLRLATDQFGAAARVQVRWYDRDGGPEAYQGFAEVDWSRADSGTDAVDNATATLRGQGARLVIVNPVP